MTGRRIVAIESSPQIIDELCRYDQGQVTDLSERAMLGLDIITAPRAIEDNTSTALGFVALTRRMHPSTGIPPEENPKDQILVRTSRPFESYSPIDGMIREHPDGIYTLIPS